MAGWGDSAAGTGKARAGVHHPQFFDFLAPWRFACASGGGGEVAAGWDMQWSEVEAWLGVGRWSIGTTGKKLSRCIPPPAIALRLPSFSVGEPGCC